MRKEPLGTRLKRIFLSEDVDKVGEFVFLHVLVPGIQDIVSSIVENALNISIFGLNRGKEYGQRNTSSQARANLYWNSSVGNQRQYANEPRPRSSNNFREIIYDTQADANRVLDSMIDLVSTYGVASISDLYSFSGLSSDNFTNNDYGWTNMQGARVVRARDGYVLELPKPILLPS